MVLALVSPHAKVDCPLAAAAHLPRAAPDLRRPAHREHTAPAVYAGSHHRARCVDAFGREEKDLPQLDSPFQTKPVSLIPTPRSYI